MEKARALAERGLDEPIAVCCEGTRAKGGRISNEQVVGELGWRGGAPGGGGGGRGEGTENAKSWRAFSANTYRSTANA